MYEDLKIAVIGTGRWGKNHVRTALTLCKPGNITVVDSDKTKKDFIEGLNSNINFLNDHTSAFSDDLINGVILATPAETHYELTKQAINAGKHVLVEKPITLHVDQAEELVQLADSNNVKLMVGHVLLYHPAVFKMKEEINAGKIGKLQYIYSNRLNLGAIRQEENILWSFAPHDISVLQYLIEKNPVSISAHGAVFLQHDIEDTTLTYLEYPNNIKAHIFVSWLNPVKEQKMVVIGDKGMLVFEDSLKEEKLKFYEKGFKIEGNIYQKFEKDYEVIDFEKKMPLTEEHIHFYNCILHDQNPRTDGKHAVEVLRILETATNQLKRNYNGV